MSINAEQLLAQAPASYRAMLEPIVQELLKAKHKRATILKTAAKHRKIIKKLDTRLAACGSAARHAVLPEEHQQHKNTAAAYEALLAKHQELTTRHEELTAQYTALAGKSR